MLAAFLLYLRRFFEPMQELSQFYNSLQSATAALEKLSGVLAGAAGACPSRRGRAPLPTGPARGEVDLPGGDASATGADRAVLPELDLTIPAGQTVALVGADRRRQVDRSPSWSPGSTTRSPARSASTGSTCATLADADLRRAVVHGDPGELPVLRHGRREHPRSAGPDADPRRDRGRGAGDRRARLHRARCPTGTTPTCASAAAGSRPGSGSWSRSPGRSWPTRPC